MIVAKSTRNLGHRMALKKPAAVVSWVGKRELGGWGSGHYSAAGILL